MKHEPIKQKRTAASQRVGDYEECIPELIHFQHPNQLALYESLTPCYQKDWARYVFSAKKDDTQLKRKQEILDILM